MKVKKEFLKKVIKYGSIDTPNYRYRTRNITKAEYQYGIIERIPLEALPATNEDWQLVATTWDGETFA